MTLEFSPRAEGDLDDITEYIAAQSPRLAVAFLENLDLELQRIEQAPLHYQLRPEIGTDARIAVVGRYVVLFRVSARAVRIERVVHGSRLLPPLLHSSESVPAIIASVSEISVQTESATYSVHIGRGLLTHLAATSVALAGKVSRVFVVTSPEIDRLWSGAIREGFLALGITVETMLVPPGEQHKRLSTLERLCEEMAAHGADRDSLLIALGGGVIGDLCGFLAAVYMRGIRFVQVPTTLLAQVDSSVGGKTGVNLAAGKNLVGSFNHPLAVFADIDTLATLPTRELRAGLQESVKAGVIRDPALFDYMEHHADRMLRGDVEALQHVVEASVRMKAEVVGIDERENGLRMILNFGHTVGHAIEAATSYKALLHGEAIGWGMVAAVRLAQLRGVLGSADAERTVALVHRYSDLPPFEATMQQLVALTGSDKKKRSGTLSFVLPVAIGRVEIVRDVTEAELAEAVDAMLNEMRTLHAVSA